MTIPVRLHEKPAPAMQRSQGHCAIATQDVDGKTRLATLRQEGCAKAFFPRSHRDVCEAVLVNTSGGLTGGDRLSAHVVAADGNALCVTTQASEKVYRSIGPDAVVDNQVELGEHAQVFWCPQSTILFNEARLMRSFTADLPPTASLTALDVVSLGRPARGERFAAGRFRDRWRIRVAGALVHAEQIAIEPARAPLDDPAALDGAAAFATLVLLWPSLPRIETLRSILADYPHIRAAAACWSVNGREKIVIRLLGEDSYSLTPVLSDLMSCLTLPLPRVWAL